MIHNKDFRLLVIDDNLGLHEDFLKALGRDKIDTAKRSPKNVDQIRKAIEENKPYALAFINYQTPIGAEEIEKIKEIWELDQDIQIIIGMEYSDYSWEKIIKELGQNENLLLIKKPFDLLALRQLSFALTKKWELIKESQQFSKLLEESEKDRANFLQYQATHDLLTGLPNRTLLIDRIQQAINLAKREKGMFSVLVFDLDRFKLVNDSFSYSLGDELLQRIAKRIKAVTRESDTIARVSGDKFIAVFVLIPDDDALSTIANKILDVFKKPFKILDTEVTISVSVGVSIFPRDGATPDELLQNAEIAMFRAKEIGENQINFYSPGVAAHAIEYLEMETALHRALEKKEFYLCYQPEIDITSDEIISAEALIRWQHPKKGLILPNDFIPLAERTGVIVPIGTWVLREACAQNKKWQDAGLAPIRIAVNISSRQFKQSNFVEVVKNILEETGLKGEFLELELTENLLVKMAEAETTLFELKKLGVSIALDDFGSGYSSLGYLRHMHIDRLKIDQSYVKNIAFENEDEIIIKAIISMAQSLNLNIVAEGVETQKQLDFLKAKHCREMQGYFFSKPVRAQALEALLKQQKDRKL